MKKRTVCFLLVLAFMMTLLPGLAFAEESGDVQSDLHISKTLEGPDDNDEYTIKLDSYATGIVKEEQTVEAVPTDFVLVLDQSGSMMTEDMATEYEVVKTNNVEKTTWGANDIQRVAISHRKSLIDSTTVKDYETNYDDEFNTYWRDNSIECEQHEYYYKEPGTENYYQVYYKSIPDDELYALPTDDKTPDWYTKYDTWINPFQIGGHSYEFGETDQQKSGKYDNLFYKAKNGTYYRVYTNSEGKFFRYYVSFFYYDEYGIRHDIGGNSFVSGEIIRKVKFQFYTNRKRNSSGNVTGTRTFKYNLYYKDADGVEHLLTPEDQTITDRESSMYSGILYKKKTTESRLSALQRAATKFVDTVKAQADETGVDYRISVVGFSGANDNSDNMELLSGVTINEKAASYYTRYSSRLFPDGKNYNGPQHNGDSTEGSSGGISTTDYINTLQNVSSGYNNLISAVHHVTAYGGTDPEYGFYMAENVLKNRQVTTYGDDNKKRNTAVVFFTDGHPGSYAYSDQITAANKVVKASYRLKSNEDLDTKVFSIGIFSEGDDQPLTYTKTVTSSTDVKTYDIDNYMYLKDIDSTTYAFLRGNPSASSSFNDTIRDYMECVSSKYPDATDYLVKQDGGTTSSNRGGVSDDETKYYMRVTDTKGLEEAFESIAEFFDTKETSVKLNSKSIMTDILSNNVTLPNGGLEALEGDGYKYVKAYYVPCTKEDDGTYLFDESESKRGYLPSSNIHIDGRTVNVDGFNYTSQENIVAGNGLSCSGNKLVVEISGLKPAHAKRMTDEYTNEEGSGIYINEEAAEPLVSFDPCSFEKNAFKVISKSESGTTITNAVHGADDGKILAEDYSSSNKYNITEEIAKDSSGKPEKLYGGIFKDEGLTEVADLDDDETGISFVPKAGKTYYLKQVDPAYLAIKTIYTNNNDELVGLYPITAIDNEYYSEVGIAKNGIDDNNNGVVLDQVLSKTDAENATLTKHVYDSVNVVTSYQGTKTYNSTHVCGKAGGKLAVLDDNKDNIKGIFAGSLQPYWITLDGVKVTGQTIRSIGLTTKKSELTKPNMADNTSSANIKFGAVSGFDSSNAVPLETKAVLMKKDGEAPEIPADTGATAVAYTLSTKGNIALNLYLELNGEAASDEGAYVEFVDLPGKNHTSSKVMVSEARQGKAFGKDCYVFPVGIAAKDMTGEIKAQFVRSDGSKIEFKPTTVQYYCNYIIDHAGTGEGQYDAESVALAKAILNYGGYTQVAFDYNTTKLANAGKDYPLPEVDKASIADPVKGGSCTGLTYTSTSTLLTTTTGIKHYFKLDGDINDYTFTAEDHEVEVKSDGNSANVLIKGIWAKDLGTPITLTVTNKNDGTTFTMSYSVYNYVKKVLDSQKTTAAEKDMAKAVYGYGEAAKAYLASRTQGGE